MPPIQSPDKPHRRPRFLPSRHKPAPSQILHSRLQEPGHTQRTFPEPSALADSKESRQFRRPRFLPCSNQIREAPFFLISSLLRNFTLLHNSTDRQSSTTTTTKFRIQNRFHYSVSKIQDVFRLGIHPPGLSGRRILRFRRCQWRMLREWTLQLDSSLGDEQLHIQRRAAQFSSVRQQSRSSLVLFIPGL